MDRFQGRSPWGLGTQLNPEEKESSCPGGAALHCRGGLFPGVTETWGSTKGSGTDVLGRVAAAQTLRSCSLPEGPSLCLLKVQDEISCLKPSLAPPKLHSPSGATT